MLSLFKQHIYHRLTSYLGIPMMMILALRIRTENVVLKEIQVNTSAFTSDLYPEPAFDDGVFEDSIFTSDAILIYDSLTKVNLLEVGNDYWSPDLDIITVNAVEITKDDPTAICGQFDSSADATVTNLLIYLHKY